MGHPEAEAEDQDLTLGEFLLACRTGLYVVHRPTAAPACRDLRPRGRGRCRPLPDRAAVEFGWFAYTPLPDEVDIPDPPSVSSRQLLGLTLTALGLAGAAATLGYHRGRRSIDRHEAQS